MKKLISLILITALTFSFVGCINPQKVLNVAESGLKIYEAGFQEGSDQYSLAEKIGNELADLNTLYGDAKKAVGSAKDNLASQIAAVADAITKDSKQLLDLTAIKNPALVNMLKIAIASADAFIAIVQGAYPDPSGSSVQLNSTSAEIKAALK